MADPLLTTLCSICHINKPQYTCPRCTLKTCSLVCSRRHKLWSSCSGIRNATAYVPRATLLTSSSIDHDYNFLHSIEHSIARTETEIIENRNLITRDELNFARTGIQRRGRNGQVKKEVKKQGQEPITRILENYQIRVLKAPEGMARSAENGTKWNCKGRMVSWQVEYIHHENETGRLMGKALGNKRLGEAYDEIFELWKRSQMEEWEIKAMKKRKAKELLQKSKKRVKLETENYDLTTLPIMQNTQTGAWNFTPIPPPLQKAIVEQEENSHTHSTNKQFFLLRPKTPSSHPKILIPISPEETLLELLRNRAVLEYPTFYVFSDNRGLPEGFMLEEEFLGEGMDADEKEGEDS